MILHDDAGFAWPIRVLDPDGQQAQLKGLTNDISMTIDPDTGMAVSGRKVSVALAIRDLREAGLEIPVAIADGARKPWAVEFNDIDGRPYRMKIAEVIPDRNGIVVCMLELLKP
jgi:hypothetical protein